MKLLLALAVLAVGCEKPYRKFIIDGKEVAECRNLQGNLKYGIDLYDCRDGINRYNLGTRVDEIKFTLVSSGTWKP